VRKFPFRKEAITTKSILFADNKDELNTKYDNIW